MTQIGPQDFARVLLRGRQPIRIRLLSEKAHHLPEFDLVRRTAQCFQKETLDPSSDSRLLSLQHTLRPGLGLLDDKRLIHQNERLGGNVRYGSPPDGAVRDRSVEGQHHWRKKIPPHLLIDAAASGAIERTALLRASSTLHERREVDRYRRAIHSRIE